MKKTLMALALMLTLIACGNKTYQINGTFDNDTYNGEYVYLTLASDTKVILDSALVKGNTFTMKGHIDSAEMCRIIASNINNTIVLERGVTNIDFTNEVSTIGGTRLNDSLNAINRRNDSLYNLYKTKVIPITRSELTDSAKRLLIDSIASPIHDEMISSLDASYASNANNVLGAYIFTELANEMDADAVDSLYNLGGPTMQNHPLTKQVMKDNQALKNTQPGKPFVNFTIPNGNLNGTSVSLSDYVGKGKYVLVDFWASWCGPCRREIPIIKNLYEEFGGDHFNVVSVAVWDKRDKSEQAIKELGMTWPQIVDAGSIPTELYAIKGIPQIILFAPDGTIVARNLRGQEMVQMVTEKLAALPTK